MNFLATFTPLSISKKTSLRKYQLKLSFRPAGSLGAPKCFSLEDGSEPPAKIFVNR